jgi:hypothetical protein
MNQIDLFKKKIKEESKASLTKQDIDNLYAKIKDGIIIAADILGMSKVDEKTLESYFQTAKNEFLSVNPISPGISHSLTRDHFKTWLTATRKSKIEWNYSNRYFKYLANSGRSEKVIKETETSSLSILEKLADPKSDSPIYSKGLVVGAVQSGKTGNFNAVVNRAIDSGYNLIIVLSGIMEDLRSQTQSRIEKDVVGEGKTDLLGNSGTKGVGNIVRFGIQGNHVIQVKTLTSDERDFGKEAEQLDPTLNDKYVLVCKKNVSVLKNLIIWLHNSLDGSEQHNIPLLIIDDEADNASLNNLGAKGKEYASKTNGHIRAILALFKVKSYLGYTATPFANVLQDRNETPENLWQIKYKFKKEEQEKHLQQVDNLFPDDFIELLNPPSNYVGAKQIFRTLKPIENNTDENEKIPLVAPVVNDWINEFPARVLDTDDGETIGVELFASKNEWEEKIGFEGYLDFSNYSEYKSFTRSLKKEDDFPKKLPESLKDAVKCFILSLAIRESRIPNMINSGLYNPHNTMLVHISRFTFWQNRTRDLIEKYVEELQSRINNENPNDPKSIYTELEKTWYSPTGYAHIVENIKDYLPSGYEDEFMTPIVYDSIKPLLTSAIKHVEIKAINSLTKHKLEYEDSNPKKVIAIGGNRLSRGFTLEGLTINYFTRITNYSDALLQMGRWFGYRPGYLDCCKIFTIQDSIEKFDSTTLCIEELEAEFEKMERLGQSPENFVLRVKKHPNTLKITRPSILKNSKEVIWSYQDQLEMTTQIPILKNHVESVWSDFKSNICPKFNKLNKDRDIIFYDTNAEEILSILTDQSNNFTENTPEFMSKFISLCNEKGFLTNWRIGLKLHSSNAQKKDAMFFPPSELNINSSLNIDNLGLAQRSGPRGNDINKFLEKGIYKASGKSANIIGNNEDMSIFLEKSQIELAKANFYAHKAKELIRKNENLNEEEAILHAKEFKTIPERYYREQMDETQGLLIIYLFDSRYAYNQKGINPEKNSALTGIQEQFLKDFIEPNNIDLSVPLVGYAIEFPPISNDPGGTYVVGDYDIEEDSIFEEDNDELGILPENEIQ